MVNSPTWVEIRVIFESSRNHETIINSIMRNLKLARYISKIVSVESFLLITIQQDYSVEIIGVLPHINGIISAHREEKFPPKFYINVQQKTINHVPDETIIKAIISANKFPTTNLKIVKKEIAFDQQATRIIFQTDKDNRNHLDNMDGFISLFNEQAVRVFDDIGYKQCGRCFKYPEEHPQTKCNLNICPRCVCN